MTIAIDKNLSGRENVYALIQHTWPAYADVLTEENVTITRGAVDEETGTISLTITANSELVTGVKEVTYKVTNLNSIYFSSPDVTSAVEVESLIAAFIAENVPAGTGELVVDEVTWNGDTWNSVISTKEDNLTAVGSMPIVAYHTLQPLVMNIFNDPVELQDTIDTLKPATQKDIFDTWPRFDTPMTGINEQFWLDGSLATGDTAAWQYQTAQQRVFQPLNTNSWTGFISKNKYDRYDHAVTIGSTGTDDDFNGVVLAHQWDGSVNHMLILAISPNPGNGAEWAGAENSSAVMVHNGGAFNPFGAIATEVVLPNPTDPKSPGNWSVKGKRRLQVIRRGDQFDISMSNWGSTTLNPAKSFSFNLNNYPSMARFKGPQVYGYFSLSQPNSYFEDLFFDAGERPDTILYAPTGKVYKHTPGAGWGIDNSIIPLEEFGAPRELRNASDGARYVLNLDGTITPIS